MGLRHAFFAGMFCSLFLMVACGSFPYKWYTMDLPEAAYVTGKLLGPESENDLPFSKCEPVQGDRAPCIAMFSNEFEQLKAERDAFVERIKELEEKLEGCE